MSTLTIYIIRHGEKPGEDWSGPGLTNKGEQDNESLVVRGWQRAGAWAALFGAGLDAAEYLVPQAVYAATPGDPKKLNQPPSRRPYETALPLAQRLNLAKPDTSFGKGQEKELVAALLNLSGVVLVAWEHKAIITDILPLLQKQVSNKAELPTHWSGKRFDVVLRFVRAQGATEFVFTELFPCLMSGDSSRPLKDDPKDD